MSAFGGFATPGQGTAVYTGEREIIATGFENQELHTAGTISGAARDAGNTPTTVLRSGLLLGKITSSGKMIEWVATATDGSQNIAGILWKELRAQDFDATNADRAFSVLTRAHLRTSALLIQGTALTSHVDEFLARQQLRAAGFDLDDDPMGLLSGFSKKTYLVTGTSDTVTDAQTGGLKIYSSASAVAVTLPTIQAGLKYRFLRTGDEEIVFTSAAGNDIICGGDASASSVTWTTASQQIGAILVIEGIYVSTTLKWLATVEPVPYSTGAFLASSFA